MNNNLLKNIVAILAGSVLAAALFWAGALISLIVLAQGVKRDSEPGSMISSANTNYLILCITAFVASFLGGLITTRMAADKNYRPALITGLLLVIMLVAINNFMISKESLLFYAAIFLPALLGARAVLRKKY